VEESDDSDYDPDKADNENKTRLGKDLWDDEENIIDGEEADISNDENNINLDGISITESNNQEISGTNSQISKTISKVSQALANDDESDGPKRLIRRKKIVGDNIS